MKRLLLTGGNGFIGSQALALLSPDDYEIHAITSRPADEQDGHIHWHQCDLLDQAQTEKLIAEIKPTHLLHFAWFVTPGSFWSAPENTDWVQASLDLFDSFIAHGGQRAVFAGSCAEYEWTHGGYCSEATTPTLNPSSLYGQAKSSLWEQIEKRAAQTGCSVAWGRIFFTFGPGEPPNRLVSSVVRSLLQDKPALCSQGTQIRDFLYVEDIASAFVHLLNSDVTGAINIGSGESRTVKDIVTAIGERLNRLELIRFGALPLQANDPPLILADITRLRDELGWQPGHTLDAALSKTIAWWRHQLDGEKKVHE